MLNNPQNGNEKGPRARLTAMGNRNSATLKDNSAVQLGAAKITKKLIENISEKETRSGLQNKVKDVLTVRLSNSVKDFPSGLPENEVISPRRAKCCPGKSKAIISIRSAAANSGTCNVSDARVPGGLQLLESASNPGATTRIANSSTKPEAGVMPLHPNSLGSVMKTDLGEILRRSCRKRKSNKPDDGDCLPTAAKGCETAACCDANEELHASSAVCGPPDSGGSSFVADWEAGTSLVKNFLLSQHSVAEEPAGKSEKPVENAGSDVLSLLAASAGQGASMAHASGAGKLLYGGSATLKRVKRRLKYFKGATYSLSIHRRRDKKKKRLLMGNSRRGKGGAPGVQSKAAAKVGRANPKGAAAAGQMSSSILPFPFVPLNGEQSRSDFANEEHEEEGDDAYAIELDAGRKKLCKNVGLKSSQLELCRLNGASHRSRSSAMEASEDIPQDCVSQEVLAGAVNSGKKIKDPHSFSTEVMLLHRGKRKGDSWCETKLVSSSSDSEGGSSREKIRKAESAAVPWSAPLSIPIAPPGDRKHITTITVQQVEYILQGHPLCTCKTQDGGHPVPERVGSYCEGIDCIDSRLIGCVNIVSSEELLRPSVRVPFLALCEVHRQRLRFHQCCPGCGLFCTQGSFLQCRSDPRKAIHHAHKECVLLNEGRELCPHCGEGAPLQEVTLELNAPRLPAFFQKQQETVRKEPGARIAFSRGNESMVNGEPSEQNQPSKSYRLSDSGKEISSAGLPIGPDRSQLEALLGNLASERQSATLRYTAKNVQTAAKNGDVEKMLQILMMGFDPNTKFEEVQNSTVLHLAATHGHLILVHVLVQAGASLDAMDALLQTPIMLSIDNGHTLVTQYLIKAGAALDARGEDGMTALHLAAKAGQLEICRMILDTGKVNVNIHDDGGWTPLVWSAEHRHLPVVKFLLERGSDPNLRDNEHNIALHWSAYSGSLEISEIFLNHGCDLNSINEHGDTPLHVAARQDRYECVMLLLARNANVDTLNRENETPMMCCPDVTSQSWLALSMTNHLKKITGNRTIRSEVIVHKDITRGKEQNPIQCVNRVDGETAPTDFLYIRENCETLPINIDRSIAALQSCQCEDDCSSPNCTCGTMSLKCWYDKEGRLIDEFNLADPPMIFECNRACFCWTTCNNRVIQHGITCRLQLFRTIGKGWGVRALRDIPRGTFICEYIGELISDLEADQREDDSYLFDLDNRDGETFCIDARRYGNISRFINHSCEPNLVPVKMFVDYQDLRFPRIALFSARPIRAYEELGFDYGDKFWIIKYKTFTCSCGSEKCKYSVDSIHETLANYNRRMTEELS